MNHSYSPLTEQIIKELQDKLGASKVLSSPEVLEKYSHDETEDLKFFPEVVVKPETADEVSSVMKLASQYKIPVTPRGGGTGLSGGALPVKGGISLSLEKMNSIRKVDKKNFQVTVESGVITQVLQEALEKEGLFYPVDPSSRGTCFIGGNIAENAGGPRAVKYGVTKDYVLNLEVVLPNGEIIWTGANTLKNSTGYSLTQLMVGSEGTLAVITKAVLKIIPHPKINRLMLAPFKNETEALDTVHKIFHTKVLPSSLEFMERDAIKWAKRYIAEIDFEIPKDCNAFLFIEVDGNDEEAIMKDCEKIYETCIENGSEELLFANSETQKNELWKMRRCLGEAVKMNSIYKEEDTVVPRDKLSELLSFVKQVGTDFGFESVCYGHAGDGNLHVNIIKGNMPDTKWKNELPKAIRNIFEHVKKLGGTISGEHGIGYVQKEYLDVVFSETHFEIMKKIKAVFDPHHILNPGKIWY